MKSRFRDPRSTFSDRTAGLPQPRPIGYAAERHPGTPRKRGDGRRRLRCAWCIVILTAAIGLSFALLTTPATSTLRGPVIDVHAAVALATTASDETNVSREVLLERINELRATVAAMAHVADAAALSLGGVALPVVTAQGEGEAPHAVAQRATWTPLRPLATRLPQQQMEAIADNVDWGRGRVARAPLTSAWHAGNIDWHNLVKKQPAGADVAFLEAAERETLDYTTGRLLRWHDYGPLARFSGCDILRDCCMVHSASAAECKRNELCGWCAATSLCFSRSNPELPERVRGAVEHACAAPLQVHADPASSDGDAGGSFILVHGGERRKIAARTECSVVVDAPVIFIGLTGRAGMCVLVALGPWSARPCDRVWWSRVSLRPCSFPLSYVSFSLHPSHKEGCTISYRSSTSAPLHSFAMQSAGVTFIL